MDASAGDRRESVSIGAAISRNALRGEKDVNDKPCMGIARFHDPCEKPRKSCIVNRCSRYPALTLRNIKSIQVHHLIPRCDEVMNKLLLGVDAAVHLSQGPQ